MTSKFDYGDIVVVRRDSGFTDRNVYQIASECDKDLGYYVDYLDTDPRYDPEGDYGLLAYHDHELISITESQLNLDGIDGLDANQLEALADPECKECLGDGLIECVDWVPYGSTSVPLDCSYECDCVIDWIGELNTGKKDGQLV